MILNLFCLLILTVKMRIKNSQFPRDEKRHVTLQENKENINSCNKKQGRRYKGVFGTDLTRRNDEKYDFTPSNAITVNLPPFLQVKTAFTPEIAPYQQSILKYIIEMHSNYDQISFKKKNVKNINARMQLLTILYRIYKKFSLRRKTLYLATYYLDRYVKQESIKYSKQQNVVAETCMLIAMKYEEIYFPQTIQWAASKRKDLIACQSKILKVLDFKLAYTSAQHFLQIYQGKDICQAKQQKAMYELILDLYLMTGSIYDEHPLKVVQEILQSFRRTSFIEKDTQYQKSDERVKRLIFDNQNVWQYLLEWQAIKPK